MARTPTLNSFPALQRAGRCGARQGKRRRFERALRLAVILLAWVCCATAVAEIEPPIADLDTPIRVTADHAQRWQEGQYDVWLLSNPRLRQDDVEARSREAVLWIDRGEPSQGIPSKIIAYLETDVVIDFHDSGARLQDRIWLGRFHTTHRIDFELPNAASAPAQIPPLVHRGHQARAWEGSGAVQPVQFSGPTEQIFPGPPQPAAAPTARSISITPRSSIRPQAESFPSPNPAETIVAITSGVRITVSGIQNVQGVESSTATLEADRIVFWTNALANLNLSGQALAQGNTTGRWEFYLEGNIVFREGDRVIYAERMYYDVTQNAGLILNAEALTPAPDYEGLVRLKADVLQQLDQQNFLAYGAALTSSRIGVPKYWFQAGTISFQDNQRPANNPFTGQVAIDPRTGEAAVDHELKATSRNNFIYVGGFPVLYWPVMATDLTKPTFYVDELTLRNDSVFGTQILVDFDLYQILGWRNPPMGTDWTLSTDYLSERGFGLGTNFEYQGDTLLRIPGPYQGFIDAWGIRDSGLDNLGADRRAVPPEQENRGRILGRHRQRMPGGFQFTGELGLISDRNFLEQYFEREWDEYKDETTGIEFKRYVANSSWSISSDVRVNDIFTQTEWLPRVQHTLIGQSLLGDRLNWHGHSHLGYANLRVVKPPQNEIDKLKFQPLAWEKEREGIYVGTRQELDYPVDVGPVKVVPYALGEMFRVGEDINGQQRTRALGQLGVRASMPFWKADAGVQSQLLNLNGLAHKVVLDAEAFWADADENLQDFPLYEQLDDDSIEAARRRYLFDTYNGTFGDQIPLKFDERRFALRTGMQSWVTAPSKVIADDLSVVKLGVRQRWQTKRGLPGQERIVDWIVLDLEGSVFPDADRDNFGQQLGLLDYDFRWHIGDRFTLLSDGYADLFGEALRTFSLGGLITRPERGTLYLGMRSIEGPISSNIFNGSVSYRMSEKWILTAGTSVDFGEAGNIGQNLSVTRIGESALVRIGFNADRSRDNVGVTFAIEPRFLASSRLGRVGGVQIPPAGAYGLE